MRRQRPRHFLAAAEPDVGGRVSFIEALSFTVVIGFIAAFASGVFDGMVPWK
jgi:hypothetical protein